MDKFATEPEPKLFTLTSFLNNPTGDSGSASQGRKLVFEDLENRFAALRKAKKVFKHSVYKVAEDIFIKVDVPSETIDDFSYEVVIKFKDVQKNNTSLVSNNIQVFSNSPSFVYSYAYTFNMYQLLIPEFSSKFDKQILADLPKVRNPDAVTFYEKTITMAMIYIRDNDLLKTGTHGSKLITLPKSKLKDTVKSAEEKQDLYNVRKKAEAQKKAAEKAAKRAEKLAANPKKEKKNADKDLPFNKTNMKVDKKLPPKTSNKINNKIDSKVKGTKVSKVNNKVDMKIK